ncbi:MAG TPA: hypothetical protein VML55_19180 [Planctomycetaceae bacterium]|nr:hypothetical protein [Planctomycetaceae bacterium]
MKILTRALWTCTLAALLAAPALAQDDKPADPPKPAGKKPAAKSADQKAAPAKRQRPAARQGDAAVNRFFQLPAEIKLADDQNDQIAALKKEYAPRILALVKKQNSVLTAEERRARRQAQQDAREAGQKGKQLQEAVAAAVKLTDEQKQQQSELATARKELQAEIQKKVESLLTDAQKAQLPKRGRAAAAKKSDTARPKNPDAPKKSRPADSET